MSTTARRPRYHPTCGRTGSGPGARACKALPGHGRSPKPRRRRRAAAPGPPRSRASASPSSVTGTRGWRPACSRVNAGTLPPAMVGDVAEGGAGDAEGHGGERHRPKRQLRHPEHDGTSTHGRSQSRNVCSAGTKTSLTTKSWLPVPHRPDTDQVSLISTSLGAQQHHPHGRHAAVVHHAVGDEPVACWQPLANDHCPVTRNPPSTTVATPVGLKVPASTTSGAGGIERVERRPRQLRQHEGPAPPITTVHADGAVGAGQLLDHLQLGRAGRARRRRGSRGPASGSSPPPSASPTRSGGSRRLVRSPRRARRCRRSALDRLEHLGLTGLAGHGRSVCSSSAHGRSIGASAGVPGPEGLVPLAAAVADDLGDPAVADLAQPHPAGRTTRRPRPWCSTCSVTKPVAVGHRPQDVHPRPRRPSMSCRAGPPRPRAPGAGTATPACSGRRRRRA